MKIIAKQDSGGEILRQQNEFLLRDYERAVASDCFQGTFEEFKEFREVGCWGIISMNRDDFSGFFQIPNGLGGGCERCFWSFGCKLRICLYSCSPRM